jgi:DNA-binding response OmpR family regulator
VIKILVVDDEPGICDMLKKTFSPIGFKVFSATGGPEALVLAKKEKPKVIFLDIRMLGMSGLEVLEKIKEMDNQAKVNIVTVLADEETKSQARKLGADEFITKPFVSEYLEELVMRQVNELLKQREKAHAGSQDIGSG